MAADPVATLVHGEENGKEDNEAPSVDEGRHPYVKAMAREKIKTSAIARKLKRSVSATYQHAAKLGVTLGMPLRKRNV
jgi:hypothetical protein